MSPIISAGAIIFRRDAKENAVKFLLLYHGRGYWNFPKGRLESGERAMAAFLREVEEETGLKQSDLHIKPGFRVTDRFVFFERQSGHKPPVERPHGRMKIVILYLVETKRAEVTVSHEHQGYGWFTYAEAVRHTKYQNTKNILKQAYDFISGNLPRNAGHSPGPRRHLRRHRPSHWAHAGVASRRDGARPEPRS